MNTVKLGLQVAVVVKLSPAGGAELETAVPGGRGRGWAILRREHEDHRTAEHRSNPAVDAHSRFERAAGPAPH